jgi:hypothetical protein
LLEAKRLKGNWTLRPIVKHLEASKAPQLSHLQSSLNSSSTSRPPLDSTRNSQVSKTPVTPSSHCSPDSVLASSRPSVDNGTPKSPLPCKKPRPYVVKALPYLPRNHRRLQQA